ncbi:MAG: FKBP-type peptidyl-prolyl cis-trans isomerase [Puniceicoccales bacterium]|jgi:FKBP-type peptidyl-prolyl cis-trans isomerase|nr:FKBP-type peptidyl-prolyl cis-trans isomerase [Puniceicoccales bacterium]
MEKLKNYLVWFILFGGNLSSLRATTSTTASVSTPTDVVVTKTAVLETAKDAATFTKEQQDLYLRALGYAMGQNADAEGLGLNDAEISQVKAGLEAAAKGKPPPLTKQEDYESMEAFLTEKTNTSTRNTQQIGAAYLKAKESEPGICKTPSGLLYKIIKTGDGVRADDDSTVEIDYEGKLIDGVIFDSTYERGEKAKLLLGALVPGLNEVCKLIGQNGEVIAYVPHYLAYGDDSVGPIRRGSTLEFNIKIYTITKATVEPTDTKK